MKNIKRIATVVLSICMLSATSCKNDDDTITDPIDQLPPETQTGENTFGCLINGEIFKVTNTSNLSAIYQQGQLQLSATIEVSTNSNESVAFNLVDPLIEGQEYSFKNDLYKAGYSKIINQLTCIYEFEDTFEGRITFTKIDQVNYTISGTFEFTTVTDNCETINITNGRFDMRYIP
ncbi:DUF6252 family protein [Hyunsoonleella sp. 2307UL5-6]|uniref:DUF6252 family protein n=1 Tax=Hyunsoonleella sp. 2307UL5-6 TaxID=3384768 RepID=UPI0039BD5614